MDTPIFDNLEDLYRRAHYRGVVPGSHDFWELELAFAEDAFWDSEQAPF